VFLTKWVAAIVFAATAQVATAEMYSPQIDPDSGNPKVALRVNNQTGMVDVHHKGRWVPARQMNAMTPANLVETNESPDSRFSLWNFLFGNYYNYWSYYPNYYYYYTPNYSLYYGYNSYHPYSWYNRGYYSYYSYYW